MNISTFSKFYSAGNSSSKASAASTDTQDAREHPHPVSSTTPSAKSTESRTRLWSFSTESGRTNRPLEIDAVTRLPTIDIEDVEECDHETVQKMTTWYYEIKDPELYRQFCEFSWRRRSTTFLCFVVLVSLFLRLPTTFIQLVRELSRDTSSWKGKFGVITCILMLIAVILMICCGSAIYFRHTACWKPEPVQTSTPTDTTATATAAAADEDRNRIKFHQQRLMEVWKFVFIGMMELYYICTFLRKAFRLNCGVESSPMLELLGEGTCYDESVVPLLLHVNGVTMVVLPLLYFISIPGASLTQTWFLFFSACAVYLATTIALKKFNSITVPVLFMLGVFFVIIDIQLKNVTIFITSRLLKEAVKSNEKINNENHASEMRHMIANVAHDLKTPLSSFTTGVDYIQITLDECRTKMRENSCTPEFLMEAITSAHSCLSNIRNTNSFMLMTINRCIDYTKASKGMKLVPHHETIDLLETLQLPLHCMQNIQHRIEIRLRAIPEEICSHIITDKQWLQENILCLLSNAVKYSAGGSVKIKVEMERKEPPNAVSGKQDQLISAEKVFIPVKSSYKVQPEVANSLRIPARSNKSKRDSLVPVDFLRFEIEDTGIGMTEEAMASLFNPFKQNQRLAGGTGLGLYSLAKRVEALSGEYGVRKRRDGMQGSLFWFNIPYKPDEVSAENARLIEGESARKFGSIRIRPKMDPSTDSKLLEASPALILAKTSSFHDSFLSPASGQHESIKTTRSVPTEETLLDILIADDSPSIVKMTTLMLKRLGHRIVVAENGEVALQVIQEQWKSKRHKFDIILMDLQMPVMDGLEATRRIRKVEKDHGNHLSDDFFPRQVIIGVSANSDHDTMEEAFTAGADAFISKPFNVATFSKTVENLLNGLPGHKLRSVSKQS